MCFNERLIRRLLLVCLCVAWLRLLRFNGNIDVTASRASVIPINLSANKMRNGPKKVLNGRAITGSLSLSPTIFREENDHCPGIRQRLSHHLSSSESPHVLSKAHVTHRINRCTLFGISQEDTEERNHSFVFLFSPKCFQVLWKKTDNSARA